MKIKRDHHIKKNYNQDDKFYKNPLRETFWFLIKLADNILFKLSPKINEITNNFFLNRKKLFVKVADEKIKKFLANTNNEFYEIQIGNQTRTCNILDENREIIYLNDENKDYFIFGISPLVNNHNIKNIFSWSLKVSILCNDKIIDELSFTIPYNIENRNKNFVYQSSDGWINFKIYLKKYNKKNIKVIIFPSFKKKNNIKNNFSISNPQFFSTKQKKNIILLSIESLTDFKFLLNKYNFSIPENIKKLINDSKYFDNTYSCVDSTLPFAASMLSALLPSQHGIGDYTDGANSTNHNILNKNNYSIQSFLKENNFITFFSGTATRFNSKYGFAKGFDFYHQINNNFENNPINIEYLINSIDNFREFNNFFFAHLDYLHEPIKQFSDKNFVDLNNIFSFDQKDQNLSLNLYREGLKKIDRDVGLLIDYLKKTKQYDDTLLIITGDHGSGFNWTKNNERDGALFEERLRVPLLIKSPVWSKDNLEDTMNITNSTTKIHKSIMSALNKEVPKNIINLPQFSEKFKNFAISETIMNPNKIKEKHAMALMINKYKYICCNDIDWKNYKITRRISEKLYYWDVTKNYFDHKKDIKNDVNISDLNDLREKAYRILNQNLEYLKNNPNDKY